MQTWHVLCGGSVFIGDKEMTCTRCRPPAWTVFYSRAAISSANSNGAARACLHFGRHSR